MPASTKGEEDKNQVLGKIHCLIFSMRYRSAKETIEDKDVEIAHYEGDWSFFPYNNERKENFHNPILVW